MFGAGVELACKLAPGEGSGVEEALGQVAADAGDVVVLLLGVSRSLPRTSRPSSPSRRLAPGPDLGHAAVGAAAHHDRQTFWLSATRRRRARPARAAASRRRTWPCSSAVAEHGREADTERYGARAAAGVVDDVSNPHVDERREGLNAARPLVQPADADQATLSALLDQGDTSRALGTPVRPLPQRSYRRR